ncbi:MAG: 3'-5' exonuclease, partial [Vibrio cyclitrophicus]
IQQPSFQLMQKISKTAKGSIPKLLMSNRA